MSRKLTKLLLIITLFMSMVMQPLAAPATVSFNTRKLNGVNMQSGSSSNYKSVTTGNATIVGFCLNKSLKSPSSGTTLTLKQSTTDAGLVYIFENGYAGTWNQSLLGNSLSNDQKYYATQLAIWLYQGKLSVSSLNQNYPEAVAAIKLYNKAKEAKEITYAIDIKSNDTNMFYDSTYYKSTLMNVTGSGYSNFKVILINATGSAEIVTTTGKVYKSGDLLPSGTSFYIRIPKTKVYNDMKITVQVSATAKVNKIYKYTTSNSDYQDVGIMMADTKSLSDDINLTLTPEDEKVTVKIIKRDAADNKPLAGATLVLKDSDGKVIDKWVTTTEAHNVGELEPGVYTVTETSAPDGYVLNSKPVSFTIVGGGDEEKIISIYNTKEETKTGKVKISKQDITTKKELPGATLTIKDANGTVVAQWISTNEPHYVTGLTPGKYILIETKSPKGYGLSDDIIEFYIDEDGNASTDTIVMYNSPIPVTADINLVALAFGFIATISLGIFSTYKLIKQK